MKQARALKCSRWREQASHNLFAIQRWCALSRALWHRSREATPAVCWAASGEPSGRRSAMARARSATSPLWLRPAPGGPRLKVRKSYRREFLVRKILRKFYFRLIIQKYFSVY